MSTLQLEHLDEKNLVALLRNESAIPEARQEAAKILYDRGSQLIHSEEFKKFKPGVLTSLSAKCACGMRVEGTRTPSFEPCPTR